jgi:hypothetical protein
MSYLKLSILPLIGLTAALLLCPLQVRGDMSAADILKESDYARGGGYPGIVMNIDMQASNTADEEGEGQVRNVQVSAAGTNSLVDFLEPPKVKGKRILMIGRNMWFITIGLRKAVPISPRQRLLGQAANGDVASTNYTGDYTPTLLPDQIVNGEPCYVLDLKAANQWVTYDRIVYWISKKLLVGIKAEFYTVSGKLFKTATFEYNNHLDYQNKTRRFISKMVITDAININDRTEMIYKVPQVREIPPEDFNLQSLLR